MHHHFAHGRYVSAKTEKEARQKMEKMLRKELDDYYKIIKNEDSNLYNVTSEDNDD